jgi:hypothetical protein
MGYEVKFVFHRRKEGGGYDTENKEERIVKVGKPFDETPLEKLAAAITSEMARRDIWVIDVQPVELARKEVIFKECKDGRGIVLKNRKFSFNEAAEMVAEDEVCEQPPMHHPHEVYHQPVVHQHPHSQVQPTNGQHPHEMLVAHKAQQNIEDLYGNPNKPVPVIKQGNSQPRVPVNPKKILYHVYFEPYIYEAEARRLKLRFTPDQKYPVHAIIPDSAGRLDNQKLAVTDDVGRIVEVDEKFFSSAGVGLMADKDHRFSGSNGRGVRKPKLAYEDQMYIDAPDPSAMGAIPQGVPVDDGMIPEHLLNMPDIRPGRRVK